MPRTLGNQRVQALPIATKIQNFEKLGHYGLDSFIISKNLSDDEGGDINRCDFFKRIIL